MTLAIRPLTREDLPLVWRLKEQAGWNQTQADLERFWKLAGRFVVPPSGGSSSLGLAIASPPEGGTTNGDWFVAELDGVGCGTVAAFVFGDNPAEAVAWIAMMLVDESLRGRGIGRALMRHALDYLDGQRIAAVRLDATPQGRPLYESLGFVAQFELKRYAGIPGEPREEKEWRSSQSTGTSEAPAPDGMEQRCVPQARIGSTNPVELRTVRDPKEHERIIDLDRAVTRTDRRALLESLLAEHKHEFRLAVEGDEIVGYATLKPGANAVYLGPCIANRSSGLQLLADAFRRLAKQRAYIDIPDNNHVAIELALSHGLAPQRVLTRMCRGKEVLEEIDRLWASSGPETG